LDFDGGVWEECCFGSCSELADVRHVHGPYERQFLSLRYHHFLVQASFQFSLRCEKVFYVESG
jgi:hypothetical protein